MPEVKTKNVELLSLYGVLVSQKSGNRNDRDGTVTIQCFAGLLQCFPLKRNSHTFVDDLHLAVISMYVLPPSPLYPVLGNVIDMRHLAGGSTVN